jgi:hypothetical protein
VDLKAELKVNLKLNLKFFVPLHTHREERGLKAAIKCSPSVSWNSYPALTPPNNLSALLLHGDNDNGLCLTRFPGVLTRSLRVVNEDSTQLSQPERMDHPLVSLIGDQQGALTAHRRSLGRRNLCAKSLETQWSAYGL